MLSSLKLIDFKVFNDVEITFSPGITAIVGPNGSGKTTILEAIEFALFRHVTRKEKKVPQVEDFIRHGRKRAIVELEFTAPINRRLYRVERSIHPGKTNADLFEGDEKNPIVSGPSSVDDEIVRLVGMDRHAFSTLTYVRQGEIDRLSRLTPKSRRSDLYSMMGLGIYDKRGEQVQKYIRDLKKQISLIDETIQKLESIKKHLPTSEEVTLSVNALERLEGTIGTNDEIRNIHLVIDKIHRSLSEVIDHLNSPELNEEFETIKEESETTQYLKEILEVLPALAESQLKPHIRAEAREIFRSIFGDRYSDLIIDDDYEVALYDLRGNRISLSAASGGEDVCVNFALRVAVNTALQKHSKNAPPGLIILDEPGAGLDTQRRMWLPTAIGSLTSVDQVLVVTHMEELRESAEKIISLTPQGRDRQPLIETID